MYMICKHILLMKFLNEPELILLHTVKWFQVLLRICNNSIRHRSFVYTLLNDQTFLFQTIHKLNFNDKKIRQALRAT